MGATRRSWTSEAQAITSTARTTSPTLSAKAGTCTRRPTCHRRSKGSRSHHFEEIQRAGQPYCEQQCVSEVSQRGVPVGRLFVMVSCRVVLGFRDSRVDIPCMVGQSLLK